MIERRTVVAALIARTTAGASMRALAASLWLDDLTSVELRELIAQGTTTVLLPIGGTEQNGAHLALGKHNVRAQRLAARIAEQLGHAVVAPVVAYVPEGNIDPPTQHMRYPGTVSVPTAAFEAVLEGAARSFHRHGFRHVVLLGDHGGYQSSLQRVADKLNRVWGGPSWVIALNEYYAAAQDFDGVLAARVTRSRRSGGMLAWPTPRWLGRRRVAGTAAGVAADRRRQRRPSARQRTTRPRRHRPHRGCVGGRHPCPHCGHAHQALIRSAS
jgi:hypothetical protein